jgi:hypothetical protein
MVSETYYRGLAKIYSARAADAATTELAVRFKQMAADYDSLADEFAKQPVTQQQQQQQPPKSKE